jgi:hypothetical protein
VKVALAPAGRPLTLRFTVPVNPPESVTVAVYLTVPPGGVVWIAGAAVREKLGEVPSRPQTLTWFEKVAR